MDCEKHSNDFDGYGPKEFAEKFVKTSYFFQREVFKEMILEYQKEADGDYKRASLKNPQEKRTQLGSSLEEMAEVIRGPLLEKMEKICNSCKKYMKNPFGVINFSRKL